MKQLLVLGMLIASTICGYWIGVRTGSKTTRIQNTVFDKEVTFPGRVEITGSTFLGPIKFRCIDPNMPADLPPNLSPTFFKDGEGKDKRRL